MSVCVRLSPSSRHSSSPYFSPSVPRSQSNLITGQKDFIYFSSVYGIFLELHEQSVSSDCTHSTFQLLYLFFITYQRVCLHVYLSISLCFLYKFLLDNVFSGSLCLLRQCCGLLLSAFFSDLSCLFGCLQRIRFSCFVLFMLFFYQACVIMPLSQHSFFVDVIVIVYGLCYCLCYVFLIRHVYFMPFSQHSFFVVVIDMLCYFDKAFVFYAVIVVLLLLLLLLFGCVWHFCCILSFL